MKRIKDVPIVRHHIKLVVSDKIYKYTDTESQELEDFAERLQKLRFRSNVGFVQRKACTTPRLCLTT